MYRSQLVFRTYGILKAALLETVQCAKGHVKLRELKASRKQACFKDAGESGAVGCVIWAWRGVNAVRKCKDANGGAQIRRM